MLHFEVTKGTYVISGLKLQLGVGEALGQGADQVFPSGLDLGVILSANSQRSAAVRMA